MAKQFYCILLLAFLAVQLVHSEEEYQRVARTLHNEYRTKHHVDVLTANDDLNRRAVQCALYYAEKGAIDHTCPHKNGAGENLWAQWGGNPSNEQVATNSTNCFYKEEAKIDYDKDYQEGTGHFTQMVWKSSREYGFGVARAGYSIYACSLYSPHGNVIGAFRDNVFRP